MLQKPMTCYRNDTATGLLDFGCFSWSPGCSPFPCSDVDSYVDKYGNNLLPTEGSRNVAVYHNLSNVAHEIDDYRWGSCADASDAAVALLIVSVSLGSVKLFLSLGHGLRTDPKFDNGKKVCAAAVPFLVSKRAQVPMISDRTRHPHLLPYTHTGFQSRHAVLPRRLGSAHHRLLSREVYLFVGVCSPRPSFHNKS
eukprot:5157879-Prymnesium_polylepis.2